MCQQLSKEKTCYSHPRKLHGIFYRMLHLEDMNITQISQFNEVNMERKRNYGNYTWTYTYLRTLGLKI